MGAGVARAYPDGRVNHFPHIIDRGKPGLIAVLRRGHLKCGHTLGTLAHACGIDPLGRWQVPNHQALDD